MLFLFDIDGTLLIKAADDHRDAILAALRRVYGITDVSRARYQTAGMTDPAIGRQIALQCGVSADRYDDRLTDFKRCAAEEYARRCRADLSSTVSPGVVPLLETLAARDDVILSLVTGNLEAIAHLKLERAGIGRYFTRGQGGFGSDSEDRSDLPGVARARAGSAGAPYPRAETVVIGDTPLDIACARADGVRVVGVCTGPFAAADLAEADHVVGSAAEVAGVLEL